MTTPLWKPSPLALSQSHMARFMAFVNKQHQINIKNYSALHRWSVENSEAFWSAIWNFCDVIATEPAQQVMTKAEKMQDTQWFLGAKLNFSENLLRRKDLCKNPSHPAILYAAENGERIRLNYAQLHQQVAALASYLKECGICVGDRIAGYLPNRPETIIAMLASASIGAVWSSCSPDFGVQGILDRFGQIEPKILFAVDGHYYNGKTFHHLDKIKTIQQKLPSLLKTIIVPYVDKEPNINSLINAIHYKECLQAKNRSLEFSQHPFNHPVYILYSSGTTGVPKCMVHGSGGTLLQHLKELMLHTDLHPQDKIFFFTTCGWMMWNWLVSSLAIGSTVVLYEGSPFYPKPQTLFDLIDEFGISVFGVGAKYLEAVEKEKLNPIETHQLKKLRTILTTGSPLLPTSFDYVYQNIKQNVCLSSISGGSDIVSCFALGNPILPVYRGELQCLGLGMNVKIFNEKGGSILKEKGELVCASAFPSMPIYFWNDPDKAKYRKAYFEKYPNVWAHGDYAKIVAHKGEHDEANDGEHYGMIIYGRSDATLNPGGIRIGTAEIYRQVEKHEEVLDGLAVGQSWHGSERIILFVKLREGVMLNGELIERIKKTIRQNTSPHHVPAKIIQIPDLPRTISGKIAELAVKNIIHDQPVKNVGALANPESLDYFRDLNELKE